MEIPDFLKEMSKQMNEQNNRCTADPLFEVRYKTSLVTESGYNESHFEIMDEEGRTLHHSGKDSDYGGLAEHLVEHHQGWCISWCEDHDIELKEGAFTEYFPCDFDPDIEDLPGEIKALSMQEIEITVNSHFTEIDAQAFIDRKQHDYPKLYIYAISMCYCWNMTKLRNWIKGLNGKQ